ncbi:MAG TPA: transcription repressor NadR [Clostridia bacterium]|jgi:hypothetical protein|nr:transcription repressor NadR [Clostridia bacterium]
MNPEERREYLLNLLKNSSLPLTGTELGEKCNVSRQVIVQDIALLRVKGANILATPQGYIYMNPTPVGLSQRTLACQHTRDDIEDELETIVGLGGKVIDVIVEHPVYGEIKGMLMLSSQDDVKRFMHSLQTTGAAPLSYLTKGVHLHTIEVESDRQFEEIKKQLKIKGYLVE